MYVFGKRSREKLDTCHFDLIAIAEEVIQLTDVDFGISEGHRPVGRQQELYAIGRTVELHLKPVTNVDGVKVVGMHNYTPSMALDFYIWHPNAEMRSRIAYDRVHMTHVASLFVAVAKQRFRAGYSRYLVRWGGNWDMDGVIDYDQSFDDFPHIELYEP